MMIELLPNWINWLFIITWLYVIGCFYLLNSRKKILTFFVILWSILHMILAYKGFYQDTVAFPPRFIVIFLPVIVLTTSMLPKFRNRLVAVRNTKWSILLHLARVPVEIVLFQLYLSKMIPELMTFEGRNFDIVVGISAPIIAFLFLRKIIAKRTLLIWNVIGLCFVLFIFVNGILSSELPIQQFAFDQPNRAILYFPFILLPATIVPIVIWTHLVDIVKLAKEIREK